MELNGHEDIFWLGWTAGRYPAPSVGTQRSGNKLAIIFQQAISDKQRPSGHRGGRCRQSLMMSSRLKALLDFKVLDQTGEREMKPSSRS